MLSQINPDGTLIVDGQIWYGSLTVNHPCNWRWLEQNDFPEVYAAGGVWLPMSKSPIMLEHRVQNGINWLDENPLQLSELENWRQKIDREELRISSVWDCVLGQLFGNFADGLKKVFPTKDISFSYCPESVHEWAIERGFADDWGTDEGEELTQIWKEKLA